MSAPTEEYSHKKETMAWETYGCPSILPKNEYTQRKFSDWIDWSSKRMGGTNVQGGGGELCMAANMESDSNCSNN